MRHNQLIFYLFLNDCLNVTKKILKSKKNPHRQDKFNATISDFQRHCCGIPKLSRLENVACERAIALIDLK